MKKTNVSNARMNMPKAIRSLKSKCLLFISIISILCKNRGQPPCNTVVPTKYNILVFYAQLFFYYFKQENFSIVILKIPHNTHFQNPRYKHSADIHFSLSSNISTKKPAHWSISTCQLSRRGYHWKNLVFYHMFTALSSILTLRCFLPKYLLFSHLRSHRTSVL